MIDFLEVGIHKDGYVMLDMKKSSNRHIAIVGRSGSGKSVAGQKIIRDIAANDDCSVVVFDTHQLFSEENIFPEFRENIKKMSNDVNVNSEGITLPLFTPLQHKDGKTEDQLDVTTAITDVLSSTMKLGVRQKEYLYEAVDFVAESKTYAVHGIAALDKALALMDDQNAVAVQGKLRYILKKNIFRDGAVFIQDEKINILRLSSFSESTQSLIVEIVLNYVWRMANAGIFMEKNICLFLDECQNLNWGKTGIIGTILSEGRKLGLQLILITQTLGGNSKSDIMRGLLQTGSQLYFSPPENETSMIARIIESRRAIQRQMILKTLEVGECVVNGSLMVNNVPYTGALKIKI